jgi:endonuclease/exonuclease/phosphatase family metal-dependent hydrolase
VSSRQLWHDLVPPPLYRPITEEPRSDNPQPVEWDRPFQHAALRLDDGRLLHVVNVHLRAPRAAFLPGQKTSHVWKSTGGWAEGFFLAVMKRAGQALEVRLAVDQVFDEEPEALLAVCGDFNAEESETPVRTIRGDEEDTANGHLAARTLVPLDRGLSDSQRYSVVHRGRRIMLDHVLVSRTLLGRYLRSEVHNETLGDELVSPLMVRGSPETYHAPVVAEFDLCEASRGRSA